MTAFIEPYNPAWPIAFNNIKKILQSELSDLTFDIQHVCSTSIPGLYAKPILDMDIITEDKNLLWEITTRLERMGFASKAEQDTPPADFFSFQLIAGLWFISSLSR